MLVSWGWLLLLASKYLHGCVDPNAPGTQHSEDNLPIAGAFDLLNVRQGFSLVCQSVMHQAYDASIKAAPRM